MRTKLCQINWHPSERDGGKNAPIMATDFAPVPHHATRPSIPSDPSTAVRIVATASQDGTVRLWKLNAAPAPTTASSSSSSSSSSTPHGFHVDYVLDFEGHQMSVNAVRFSPNGECIATGGDDGYVIVWYMTTQPMDTSIKAATSWHEVETPRQLQRVILRGKLSEICDLSWTHDSKYIVTGSVDGTVGVWDVKASKLCHQLKDHKGFVQGVATDPRGEYFTSQCASRTCRIHKVDMTKKMARSMFKTSNTLRSRQVHWDPVTNSSATNKNSKKNSRASSPVPPATTTTTTTAAESTTATEPTTTTTTTTAAAAVAAVAAVAVAATTKKSFNSHALYLDNISTTTFFRRPTWTVDGSLLMTPTGQFKANPGDKYQNTTYMFARNQWESPVAHFPIGQAMPTVGVRCNPVLFELRTVTTTGGEAGTTTTTTVSPAPLVQLPYRMILAVLSTNAIMLYDTQHTHMLSIIRNQHCANLTDVAWSNNGRTLFVTSSDGFCSVVEFADQELGVPLARDAYPTSMQEVQHQPWFANRAQEARKEAQEKALHKVEKATAVLAVSGRENAAAVAAPAAVVVPVKSKKRRVSLVAVSQSEASKGNLMGSP